ncbi:MAG: zf-HC2 domain-containing protein, partial [Planctomycetota bacterium]
MTDHDELPRLPCGLDEADLTALARGELESADAAIVRSHLDGCASCASLLEEIQQVLTLTAARPAPSFDTAARTRLLDTLDDLLDEEEAPRRGRVLPMLDRAASVYASSRSVRFLTLSVGVHAAAAVLLGIWLQVAPDSPLARAIRPDRSEPVDVARAYDPYPLEKGPDALLPPELDRDRVPSYGQLPLPLPENPWGGFGSRDRRLPDLPDGLEAGPLRLFPNEEFRSWAAGRFRTDRVRRLKAAWGDDAAPRTEKAVERALSWLAWNQGEDGTWTAGPQGASRRANERFRVGVTAEALRALMADGQTAYRAGAYDEVVRRGLDALLRSADEKTGVFSDASSDRPFCNHGPALAALSEAYGLDYGLLPDDVRNRLRTAIERGVTASLAAQQDDGSFGYHAEDPRGDTSVTLLQVDGLEAARRAGFEVDAEVLTRAGIFVARRMDEKGRLGYEKTGDRATDATLT